MAPPISRTVRHHGQRGVEAVFAMDGADISDPEMGGATFSNFNVDAVEADPVQFRVDACRRLARGPPGSQNIVTRSGASGFHGHFLNSYATPPLTRVITFDHCHLSPIQAEFLLFRRNEFGSTNGGPVYLPHVYDGRSRTFYFAQFQGFRQVLGNYAS